MTERSIWRRRSLTTPPLARSSSVGSLLRMESMLFQRLRTKGDIAALEGEGAPARKRFRLVAQSRVASLPTKSVSTDSGSTASGERRSLSHGSRLLEARLRVARASRTLAWCMDDGAVPGIFDICCRLSRAISVPGGGAAEKWEKGHRIVTWL